jgi:hypothetical protein
MDVQAKRIELVKWILSVQEELLYKVSELKEKSSPEIVAYTVQEEPLTKSKYIKKVKDAEKRIDQGDFTSHEDLAKEMKDW